MNKNNKKKKPGLLKLSGKALLLFLVLYILVIFIKFTIDYAAGEYDNDNSLAQITDRAEELYREKEYAKLREILQLYDAYDECFDVYWEAVDGFTDYMNYIQWKACEKKEVEGSAQMVDYYIKKIQDNVTGCKFAQNSKQLKEYLEKIYK